MSNEANQLVLQGYQIVDQGRRANNYFRDFLNRLVRAVKTLQADALTDADFTDADGVKSLTVPNNTTISTFAATVLDDASASAARTTLGAAASTHTHAAGDITSGTLANARISEGSVTQHESAIDAGSVDGYHLSVVSSLPGSPDANTIYFVEA